MNRSKHSSMLNRDSARDRDSQLDSGLENQKQVESPTGEYDHQQEVELDSEGEKFNQNYLKKLNSNIIRKHPE